MNYILTNNSDKNREYFKETNFGILSDLELYDLVLGRVKIFKYNKHIQINFFKLITFVYIGYDYNVFIDLQDDKYLELVKEFIENNKDIFTRIIDENNHTK